MIKIYAMLTKPGIIMGNIITTIAGFALASKGHFDFPLLLAIVFGLALVIGSACVFNNYIDRKADQKMERTKNRPFARGLVNVKYAIWFALFLAFLGITLLSLTTNVLTVLIATFGFFVYVALYSVWKYLSVYGTIIGSVSGAVPPLVGYVAVSNQFDMTALLLFLIMFFWQMPHFFAIALYRLEDYTAAAIPVLPVKKGTLVTKVQMVTYIIVFTALLLIPAFKGFAGMTFLILSAVLGTLWTVLALLGFRAKDDQVWGKQMFRYSLIVVTALSIMISIDASIKPKAPIQIAQLETNK